MAHSANGSQFKGSLLAAYANYFEIGYNAAEFLIDVGQIEPESGSARLSQRIALSPAHAKLLSWLLENSIEEFERNHGQIPDLAEAAAPGDFGLTNPRDFEQRAVDARRRAVAQHSDPAKR